MGFVVDSLFGSGDAGDAAREASGVAAAAQTEALDYLKEVDALPREIRENALTGLSSFYHVPDQSKSQAELIRQAINSPLYKAIMGGQRAGEQSILRNASATGMLRSGNSIGSLRRFSTNLSNEALLKAYNEAQGRQDYEQQMHLSGLGALANLPSNASAIANLIAGIGQTKAYGITAGAQADAESGGNAFNNILNLGTLGLQAYKLGMFSDIRLKRNIRHLGTRGAFNWYGWEWIPEAAEFGLEGRAEGVLAHEVHLSHPEAVHEVAGFVVVDYAQIGLEPALEAA